MKDTFGYVQKMDVKYDHQEVIEVHNLIEMCTDPWFNQTPVPVNESVVRLGIVEGEYHWHKHEDEDEFFFVLSGKLYIDLEDRTIELNPNEGTTISEGVVHRPRAPIRTAILMVETDTIDPIGQTE